MKLADLLSECFETDLKETWEREAGRLFTQRDKKLSDYSALNALIKLFISLYIDWLTRPQPA